MISVVISINGQPIMARSARNAGQAVSFTEGALKDLAKYCRYVVDDGTEIIHHQDDGAVALAIELLKTIKEP